MTDAAAETGAPLRMGQLARLCHVSVETVRHYDRLELLPRMARSAGGQRRLPSSSVQSMQVIKAVQRLGYSLTEISELFHAVMPLAGSTQPTRPGDVLLVEVDERIADLEAIRGALASWGTPFPTTLPSDKDEA